MKGKAIMIAVILLILIVGMLPTASAKATVVRGGAIWNDGTLYRTVLTPTDLTKTNAPDHSYDILYNFDGSGLTGQRAVADAAPGDTDYNGGRWKVFAVTFTAIGIEVHDTDNDGNVNFELTSDEMVLHHVTLGHITISDDPVKMFVCPMIKLKDQP